MMNRKYERIKRLLLNAPMILTHIYLKPFNFDRKKKLSSRSYFCLFSFKLYFSICWHIFCYFVVNKLIYCVYLESFSNAHENEKYILFIVKVLNLKDKVKIYLIVDLRNNFHHKFLMVRVKLL